MGLENWNQSVNKWKDIKKKHAAGEIDEEYIESVINGRCGYCEEFGNACTTCPLPKSMCHDDDSLFEKIKEKLYDTPDSKVAGRWIDQMITEVKKYKAAFKGGDKK